MPDCSISTLINFSDVQEAIDAFDINPDSTSAEINEAFSVKERDIFSCLNRKLITGEYIDLNNCAENLRELEFEISKVQASQNAFIYERIETNGILLEKKRTFFSPIFHAISSLLRFIDGINQKIKFSDKRFYLNESFRDILASLNGESVNRSVLFDLNLFIANCDHFVGISDHKMLQRLEEVVDLLYSYSGDMQEVASALKSKSIFLRNKLLFRRVQEHRFENEGYEIFISKPDGNTVEFDAETYVETNELKPYVDWNRYLLSHYEIDRRWNRSITENITDDVLANVKVLDLHRRIKYYKDIDKSPQGLKHIRKSIIQRLQIAKENRDTFDIYALKICLSYCYNNEFSLMCEQSEEHTFEEISQFYKEIDKCAETNPIKNYFIQAKLIKHKTELISKYFNDKDALYQNLDKCEQLLDECKTLEGKYFEGVSWVKQNYNYVFQLPKDECFVEDNVAGSIEKVFVYSSVVLPINRSSLHLHLREDLETLRIFTASVENLRVTKKAQDEISKLTDKLEESQKELSKKDSKYLEILALFAAIVAFTAGTIPGFKFIDTGVEAVFFTLALGSSMALFALLFYAINRGTAALKSLKNPLIIGGVFIVVMWLFLYIGSNFDFSKSFTHEADDNQILLNESDTLQEVKTIETIVESNDEVKNDSL